ncbi:UNVERIFIED_CONTAM: hypothetical protein Scaly_2743600 [Sesamum calycinum]|uniref:Uncharacterized protein n=1 Tax=Sesamum calycinum TaxID=2727403 RepID=A0AAW2J1C9_9LAMI
MVGLTVFGKARRRGLNFPLSFSYPTAEIEKAFRPEAAFGRRKGQTHLTVELTLELIAVGRTGSQSSKVKVSLRILPGSKTFTAPVLTQSSVATQSLLDRKKKYYHLQDEVRQLDQEKSSSTNRIVQTGLWSLSFMFRSLDQVLTRNILREDKKSFGFEAKPFSAVTEFFCSNLQNRRGKAGKSIERACSALALVPSAKLRRDKSNGFLSGIVGRMKWYEALVDIASVPGMRLGRSSIGNERRSGGTCGTTYWITPVRHEAADAESAPMPLAMPCLVPRHGGGSVARHEHRAKGRTRSSEGQPAHTASGEDGTTGKDRLAKTPQARSVVGLRRGSIGRKGRPDGGRARGGRSFDGNGRLFPIREGPME